MIYAHWWSTSFTHAPFVNVNYMDIHSYVTCTLSQCVWGPGCPWKMSVSIVASAWAVNTVLYISAPAMIVAVEWRRKGRMKERWTRGEREGRWQRTERTIRTDGRMAAKRERENEGRDVEAKPCRADFSNFLFKSKMSLWGEHFWIQDMMTFWRSKKAIV